MHDVSDRKLLLTLKMRSAGEHGMYNVDDISFMEIVNFGKDSQLFMLYTSTDS